MSSLTFNEFKTLMSQVLPLLDSKGLWWKRCVGTGKKLGMTDEDLLEKLLVLDSETWDLELLHLVLDKGLKMGTIKQYPVGFYFINSTMIINNRWNSVFSSVVSGLCDPKLQKYGPLITY